MSGGEPSPDLELYRQFAQRLPDPILLVSRTGVIESANLAVRNRLGLEPNQLVGRALSDVARDDPESVSGYLRCCRRTREPVPGRLSLERNHHESVSCRCEGSQLGPPSNTAPGWVLLRLKTQSEDEALGRFVMLNQKIDALMHEIQRRREVESVLQAQREFFRVTLASLSEAVIITDLQGQVTFLNAAAEQLTGWSRSEAIGQPLNVVYRVLDEQTRIPTDTPLEQVLQRLVCSRSAPVVLTARDGAESAIEDTATPIQAPDGTIEGIVLVIRDVSEHRRLVRELQDQTEQLQEADRRKNQYLAMLAHELRNPLAATRFAVSSLVKPADRDSDVRWATEILNRQLGHLTRIVDDLLDLSRLQHGRIEPIFTRIDLAEIVTQVVELAQPWLLAKRQTLEVQFPTQPIPLEADPTRMVQALGNLLHNASKFSPEGASIRLSARRDEAAGEIALGIEDEGVGIAPDLLPQIFDLFVQADRSLDRAEGGLGVGLTIAKGLIELHGGRITAESAGPGKGSAVRIFLPMVLDLATVPIAPSPSIDQKANPTTLRILAVDDNLDTVDSLARWLQVCGYEVQTAHDGPSGMAIAETFQPDVVLLDIGLPGMNGHEVAARLRQLPGFDRTVLVALTGYGQQEHRAQAFNAGFDHYLTKPADPNFLQALIESMLSRHHGSGSEPPNQF